MELAMIGLGKMGGNMTERLLRGGHRVVAYDRNPEAVQAAVAAGAAGAATLEEMVQQLSTPRVIWMMVPAGAPVDSTIAALQPLLQAGDILIDGGEVMAQVQLAMMGKLPYTVLRDAIFAHPTLAESLNNLFSSFEE